MKKTFAARFFSATAYMLLGFAGFLGLLFVFFANRYLERERLEQMDLCITGARRAFRDSISVTRDPVLYDEQRRRLRDNLRLITDTTDTTLILADENGKVIVCTQIRQCRHEGSFAPARRLRQLDGRDKSLSFENIYPEIYSDGSFTLGRAARDENGDITGYVFAFSDASSVAVFTRALMTIFFVSARAMLLAAGFAAVVVTDRLTNPLSKITDAAARFGRGDFSVRVPVDGEDEVAKLSRTFNRMADFVERNEKSRSSFVANVAHELRTPMTSIKGFVDGIRDGTIPPEDRDRYLEVVSSEIGRLARLTNSMLDISRLESGEFVMNVKNYNIWDTVAAVAFSMESRIEAGGITLKNFRPEKVMVYADEDIIHQVVYNIFGNALKFTPPGGYISLSVARNPGSSFVTVRIRNSGEGISKEALPYVFERFYKADASRSVHTRGAGIGLFIAKTLIRRSGGEIWVESEEGSYTEFSFTIPRGRSQRKR